MGFLRTGLTLTVAVTAMAPIPALSAVAANPVSSRVPATVAAPAPIRLAQAAAAGAVISIPIPGAATVDVSNARYTCADGQTVSVDYYNAGTTSLAVIALKDETVVAALVIAASGAKYEGGQFTWWTKGPEADLYDVTKGDTAVHCVPAA